ncbi:histidine phosphatase family protein [Nesterenkonia muleiensis]|uniref:histidine phosphatase family protein n=1 Tax=Nesterenkonia muleiensis TaxID=2282648 RepID=UPI000E753316|nr:histidine phosphatase family protein [Nesterenkonia muleiensis]
MSELTRLLLVRHGQTPWTVEHRLQGQTDIPLNGTGREQAAALRPSVQEFAPESVLSSPAQRAAQTAQILSPLEPVYDDRLKEADLGQWEGRTAEEIGADYLAWRAGTVLPPGAEPRETVVDRVKSFLQDAAAVPGNVLIVTHGGVIRAALHALVGLRIDQIVPVAAASLTVLDLVTEDLSQARLRHYNLSPSTVPGQSGSAPPRLRSS